MEDYIIRATAANLGIRAFAATTKNLVEEARKAHNTSPVATAALGRLMSAGVMMGSMLKGSDDLLTLQIKGDGPIGAIIVTADSKGGVKGYVHEPNVLIHANAKGKLDVAGAIGNGELCVLYDTGLKDPYMGRTNLVSGEIAEDLTYYYALSEQTPSSVALGVLMSKTNHVKQAGGMIIQLLPGASEELINTLEQNLSKITSITSLLEEGYTPEMLLEEVLGDLDLEIMDKIPAKLHCNCSKEHVQKAIISIGENDIKELIAEGKEIEVNCHFCNKHYMFSIDELKEMLAYAMQ